MLSLKRNKFLKRDLWSTLNSKKNKKILNLGNNLVYFYNKQFYFTY